MSYDPPAEGSRGVPPPPPPEETGGYGSGYGTPTRPVGEMAGMPGAAPEAGGGLFDSYKRTVLSPSVEVFENEIPRASWNKTLIGIGLNMLATAIVAAIIFYLFAVLFPELYDPARNLREIESMLSRSGLLERFRWFLDLLAFLLSGWGIVASVVWTPIAFFLGASAQFVAARLFGGRGTNFLVHAYLLSLSYAPLRVASNLGALVPIVGGLASFAFLLYQFYLAGLSMQASQRMEPGKAMMAAFIPLIVTLLLLCVGLVVLSVVLASMFRPG